MSSVNVYSFENGEKISPFSKISGYVWKEPKFDFHFKLHLLSASFASLILVFAFLLTDTYTSKADKVEQDFTVNFTFLFCFFLLFLRSFSLKRPYLKTVR